MATTGTRDAAVGSLVRQASWIIAKMQRRSEQPDGLSCLISPGAG